MIWESGDDPTVGRPGGNWQGMRPRLDSPMTWSVSLIRLGSISIRVHWLFLLFVIVLLLKSIMSTLNQPFHLEFQVMAMALVIAGVILVLHEMGHIAACRIVGGTGGEIILWPLGGLAFGNPPPTWRGHLWTALGGPIVNVLLCAAAAFGLWMQVPGAPWQGLLIPNPRDLVDPIVAFELLASPTTLVLYLINWISFMILVVNLLPIFPLDGARVLHAILWAGRGYSSAMVTVVRVGLTASFALGFIAFVEEHVMLLALAFFGGMTCWTSGRQLEFTEGFLDLEDDAYALGLPEDEPDDDEDGDFGVDAPEGDEPGATTDEAEQLDDILEKVRRSGLESLTPEEQDVLRRATERRRGDDEPGD